MFPILKLKVNGKKLVYLDNAATTQKLQSVINAEKEYYEKYNSNVHRSVHFLAQEATELYELTREKIAAYIGAKQQEVIFTSGTTEGINIIARGVENLLDENSTILLTQMEHHSNIVPWQELARRTNAKLEYVKIKPNDELDWKDLESKLTSEVAIFAFTHVSNVTGQVNSVKEMCKMAKSKGVITVIDGAQAIAHLPVDVKEIDCDFYAFSGHKMYGPTGTGVLYGKLELLESMQPSKFGGEMIKEVTFKNSTWNELPYKFEAGTPNIAGVIALGSAIDFLKTIKWKHEREKEQKIISYLLKQLPAIPNLTLHGTSEKNRVAIFSFSVKNLHAHDLAQELDAKGIAVRAGHHCAMPLHSLFETPATIRASFATYNTLEDAKYVVKCLKKAVKNAKRKKITEKEEVEELKENSENVNYYYSNQKHRGALIHARSATEKNQLCGDELTVYLTVKNGKIHEAKFEGNGCMISQASANALCEILIEMPLTKINDLTIVDIQKILGVKLGVVRSKCAELPIKVARKALQEKTRSDKYNGA